METVDRVARLIAEVVALVGWDVDPNAVAERVRRLHKGLPAEDEFSVICSWLGRCRIVHKLDQTVAPKSAFEQICPPDLFAAFEVNGRVVSTLIEVKTCNDNVLSLRPDYLHRLRAYAGLAGHPLLFAWKHPYGVWSLFDSSALRQADKNFNINFQEAMRQNLLSQLAGDFAFVLQPGAGVHLQFRKVRLLGEQSFEGTVKREWETMCDRVWFSGADGRELTDLPNDLSTLLMSWNLSDSTQETDTHIVQSFVSEEEHMEFAHTALVRLLDWSVPRSDELIWRSILDRTQTVPGIDDFREIARRGISAGLVRLVLEIRPVDIPQFLAQT